jgi:L-fuculose-phosphate aldolase
MNKLLREERLQIMLSDEELNAELGSVLHAHPPVATGFATAGRALNLALLPEVVIGLGCVRG